MIGILKNLLSNTLSTVTQFRAYHGSKYRDRVILSEIIRNVHSIEKGLCMENPRKEFGLAKIDIMLGLINEYRDSNFDTGRYEIATALQALKEYFEFNENSNNPKLVQLKTTYETLASCVKASDKCATGGTKTIYSTPVNIHGLDFEDFIRERHSVRSFSNIPLDKEKLWAAIDLSRFAPSACNRQTSRVYVLGKEKINELGNWISGVGGFIDDIQNILVITGRTSAFNDGEINQYIVNASIYTAYLYMCLNAYGIAGCIIQRPLLFSKQWVRYAKDNGISGDEKIVCMIAIGMPKDKSTVPASLRFPVETYAKEL